MRYKDTFKAVIYFIDLKLDHFSRSILPAFSPRPIHTHSLLTASHLFTSLVFIICKSC